jgi:hypothetical protein
MPGKRVQFDQETWNALDLLARDRMQDFQELADEAFADLLRSAAGRSTSRRRCDRVSAKSRIRRRDRCGGGRRLAGCLMKRLGRVLTSAKRRPGLTKTCGAHLPNDQWRRCRRPKAS